MLKGVVLAGYRQFFSQVGGGIQRYTQSFGGYVRSNATAIGLLAVLLMATVGGVVELHRSSLSSGYAIPQTATVFLSAHTSTPTYTPTFTLTPKPSPTATPTSLSQYPYFNNMKCMEVKKFNDRNGNGEWDPGDPGKPGEPVLPYYPFDVTANKGPISIVNAAENSGQPFEVREGETLRVHTNPYGFFWVCGYGDSKVRITEVREGDFERYWHPTNQLAREGHKGEVIDSLVLLFGNRQAPPTFTPTSTYTPQITRTPTSTFTPTPQPTPTPTPIPPTATPTPQPTPTPTPTKGLEG